MLTLKNDIENRKDVELLTRSFYTNIRVDQEMKYLYDTFGNDDTLEFLDKFSDFWCAAILGEGDYDKDLIEKHLYIHFEYALKKEHFNHWISVWGKTVDDHFQGEKANLAKQKAFSLAAAISMKIDDINRQRLEWNN